MKLAPLLLILLLVPVHALNVNVSSNVGVNEKFNITVKLNGSSVVGLALELPNGLEFVNSSVPYKISDNTVALAIVNGSYAICTLKALKCGRYELKIKWSDFLSGKNGTLVRWIYVSPKPSLTPTETVTPTATPTRYMPTPTPTTPVTPTKKTPGFEFMVAILAMLIALRRW